jgi:hypothetical protein
MTKQYILVPLSLCVPSNGVYYVIHLHDVTCNDFDFELNFSLTFLPLRAPKQFYSTVLIHLIKIKF